MHVELKINKQKSSNRRSGKKLLAIIPARGGSKGIPGKNIRKIAGLPLIGWTILAAKKSKLIDRLIVSTENKKIARVARFFGAEVPFLRPNFLSRAETPGVDVIVNCCVKIPNYKEVVCLQPTSPLRTAKDIDALVRFARRKKAVCVMSVNIATSHPAWVYGLGRQCELKPFLKHGFAHTRQKLSKAYALNGAIYYAQTGWLVKNKKFITKKTLGFIMPAEQSVDIDDWSDWKTAESVLKNKTFRSFQKKALLASFSK